MADPEKERLDRIQDEIDDARRQAEAHGTLDDGEPKQTLADPDGDGRTEPYQVQTGG